MVFLLFVVFLVNVSIIGQEKVKREGKIQVIKPSRLYKTKIFLIKLIVSKIWLSLKSLKEGARCLSIHMFEGTVAFRQRKQASLAVF